LLPASDPCDAAKSAHRLHRFNVLSRDSNQQFYGIERDPDNGRRYRRTKVGSPVSVESIYVEVTSSVDVQAECNPACIAKLRFFLKWMKACGLHVAKTALKPDIPIEGRAACHFHRLLD
jgi:hypothetical protein